MKILLCGGGPVIHVLSTYASARLETHVTILSLFPGEVKMLRNAIPEEGIRCTSLLGEDVLGKPNAVIDKAKDVPNDLDVVILAVPSFAHKVYLQALKPHLKPGVTIGAMPGGKDFDYRVNLNLGLDFARRSNLFTLETLPWAYCCITEYGKSVEVLETEEEVEVIVSLKDGTTNEGIMTFILHNLIGGIPAFDPTENNSSPKNINSAQYPTISQRLHRNKDNTKRFDKFASLHLLGR